MEDFIVKKDYINQANLMQPKTGVLFIDFISNIIEKKSKRMGVSYSRNYKTLIYHLNRFCEETGCILYTNSIGEEFLDDFICYLESLFLKRSYIKTILFVTKAMIRKAAIYGYAVDQSYDDVDLRSEESFSIALSPNDIARIYYFTGLTKKQERIRDLFVVGCYTALRYSDLSTLTKENFKDGYITKITKKNGIKVVIPVHDFVDEIFKKYEYNVPANISAQHFNRYIKYICSKVGLNDEISFTENRGGQIHSITKQRWQLISSHTARRSGATNLYNTGRLRLSDISAITGHTTEKSLMRYIKNSKYETARQIAGDNFFRK